MISGLIFLDTTFIDSILSLLIKHHIWEYIRAEILEDFFIVKPATYKVKITNVFEIRLGLNRFEEFWAPAI